ncbi:MAG TPA: metal ABC transporter permease [Actinomycetota bacterium]
MISALPLPYPFELTFMQRALIAGVVVGAFAPMIGTFLVQKRMSLIGDGIGHLAFAGVGAGLVATVSPVWTALVFAVAGALGIEWLRSRRRASGDLALALFFYSGIALGVVLVSSSAQGLSANVLTYLFGQPLTASAADVRLIVVLGAVIIGAILATRRVLFAVVTDEEWSSVARLPVGLLNSLLAILAACAVVVAMKIVGILLIAAMMVLPVASGQLLARSFRGTLAWSAGVGMIAAVVGLAAARVWDLAPSGCIVLVSAIVFAIVAIATRGRGSRILSRDEELIEGSTAMVLDDSHPER